MPFLAETLGLPVQLTLLVLCGNVDGHLSKKRVQLSCFQQSLSGFCHSLAGQMAALFGYCLEDLRLPDRRRTC